MTEVVIVDPISHWIVPIIAILAVTFVVWIYTRDKSDKDRKE